MHYLVCVKQVPDSRQMRIDPVSGTLIRTGVPAILNPYDIFAVSAAVNLKHRYGGKISVLTMGPLQAVSALQECIAMGCDQAFHLTDIALAGSDTLATSYALVKAIEHIHQKEPIDIIFTGKQTIDGDTAQVGPGIATRLDWSQITYCSRILRVDWDKRLIVVERKLEKGWEIVEAKLPVLIMCLPDFGLPPRTSPAQMLLGFSCTPIQMDTRMLEMDRTRIGLKGSPTIVKRTYVPTEKRNTQYLDGKNPKHTIKALLKLFQEKNLVG
ncbi:MAG: electron transfer flavoprotein subunit beta/FixA family protein [bacterium]